ncbi:MAG: FAD-binding protein [Rhodobacteraceae bacterium]|nr:FAD-binding protein [Paracoccaceae bacterium]
MRPASESELANLITGRTSPVIPCGGGTRPIGLSSAGERLYLDNLNRVTQYEPGALTLVAEAGTPLKTIFEILNEKGQMFPFEPIDYRGLLGRGGEPTVGGMVATNSSGPRRVKVGACRDYVIGLRFVDGEGNIIKSGGRVMKNVTGYDLTKLLTGSFGTLGIITEVALKVLPAPTHAAVLLIEGLSEKLALQVLNRSLNSPFEVSGAAHLCSGVDGQPVTMIRLEGFQSSVMYRVEELSKFFEDSVSITVETDPERTREGWEYIRDVGPFQNREGDVWKIITKPSEALLLVEGLRESINIEVFYDWAGSLIWALVKEGTNLRDYLQGLNGHATLIRANDGNKSHLEVFHQQSIMELELKKRLKNKFDPGNILNQGMVL